MINENNLQYWFKPLVDGDWAFCVMNTGEEDANLSIDWSTLEVNDTISNRRTRFSSINYSVKDLWNTNAAVVTTLKKGTGMLQDQYVINVMDVTVKPHDVVAYKLSPITK